jgi:hypothetical protein
VPFAMVAAAKGGYLIWRCLINYLPSISFFENLLPGYAMAAGGKRYFHVIKIIFAGAGLSSNKILGKELPKKPMNTAF